MTVKNLPASWELICEIHWDLDVWCDVAFRSMTKHRILWKNWGFTNLSMLYWRMHVSIWTLLIPPHLISLNFTYIKLFLIRWKLWWRHTKTVWMFSDQCIRRNVWLPYISTFFVSYIYKRLLQHLLPVFDCVPCQCLGFN